MEQGNSACKFRPSQPIRQVARPRGHPQLAHLAAHVSRLGKTGISVVGQKDDGKLARRIVQRALVGLLAGPHAVDVERDRLAVVSQSTMRFHCAEADRLGETDQVAAPDVGVERQRAVALQLRQLQ